MNGNLRSLAGTLQQLFTESVETLNHQLGFVQRRRHLSAGLLVRLLVFGWIARPRRAFVELAEQAQVSAQALQQRLTDQAVALFQGLLREALTHVFTARRPLIPLLRRFAAIEVHDATQLRLPASLAARYPACGGLDGQRGRASWKLPLRFDVLRGGLQPFALVPGKTSDRSAVAEPLAFLQAGVLYLADLGYFCLDRLQEVVQRGAHYVSRLPARVTVRGADGPGRLVGLWLQPQGGDRVDAAVRLGEHGAGAARLVAFRLPEAVAAERRRKLRAKSRKQRRPVSRNQVALCDWWAGITDLPAPELSAEEIQTLYRLRWQVELLFRHWKQACGLGCSHGRTAASVQVEYLAKLLGAVVTHWQALLAGGPLEGKNRLAIHRRVCAACEKLAAVWAEGGGLSAVERILEELAATLQCLRRRPRRQRTASTRQRLYGKRVRT